MLHAGSVDAMHNRWDDNSIAWPGNPQQKRLGGESFLTAVGAFFGVTQLQGTWSRGPTQYQ